MNFKLGGGRPEFYHVERYGCNNVDLLTSDNVWCGLRNQNGRIFEPDHVFEIVVYGTKNNCQVGLVAACNCFRSSEDVNEVIGKCNLTCLVVVCRGIGI